MFFIVCLSCQNQMDGGKTSESEEIIEDDVQLTSLEGTRWKLEGLVEVGKGIIKEFEPEDCEECYTLTFDSDSTADSRSITDFQRIDLMNLVTSAKDVNWEMRLYYERYEKNGKVYDVEKFLLSIAITQSCFATNEELKLFHSGCFDKDLIHKNYYLLYKRINE